MTITKEDRQALDRKIAAWKAGRIAACGYGPDGPNCNVTLEDGSLAHLSLVEVVAAYDELAAKQVVSVGDMPTFTLQAKDNLAVDTMCHWCDLAEEEDVPPSKIDEVRKKSDDFLEWRRANRDKCKLPD